MHAAEPCDLAIWDVSGDLLNEVRNALRSRVAHDGPKLAVETGECFGTRTAIARPQRVIAKHAPTSREAIRALVSAYRPRLVVAVGPASAKTSTHDLGEAMVLARLRCEEIEVEEAVAGHNADRASPPIATDWAQPTLAAAEELGVAAILLAIVTQVLPEGCQHLTPPTSRPATNARRAGAFLGGLLAGKLDLGQPKHGPRQAATRVIESITRSLP